jgi:hypothetical protein
MTYYQTRSIAHVYYVPYCFNALGSSYRAMNPRDIAVHGLVQMSSVFFVSVNMDSHHPSVGMSYRYTSHALERRV